MEFKHTLSIGKEITVKKQPVGKFIQALKVLKRIPQHLSGFSTIDQNAIIAALPEMIASSYDEVKEIITIATDLTAEEVDQLFAEELIEVAADIIQANEFDKLGETVKKKFGNLNLKMPKLK